MVLCIGFPCARWFTKVNVSDKTYDAHFKVGKQENFRSINPPTPEVKVLSSKFFTRSQGTRMPTHRSGPTTLRQGGEFLSSSQQRLSLLPSNVSLPGYACWQGRCVWEFLTSAQQCLSLPSNVSSPGFVRW